MVQRYDVVIIGAGTAGLSALSEVRKRTDSFLLVNQGAWGTTCARVGCMPSKALIEAADLFHRRTVMEEMGIAGGSALRADGAAVMSRVRRLRDGFVAGVLKATDDLGERSVSAHARLLGPGLVEVGGRRVETDAVIVAAGSSPVIPKGWRDIPGVITSDNLFELSELPRSMAVVGLGAVGLEIAQALSRLGVQVQGFDAAATMAGLSDSEVLSSAIRSIGSELPLHLETQVDLKAADDGVRVSWNDQSAVFDMALVAVGRRPNLRDLGLENLGVELDGRGLPDFDPATMRVGDLPVYLAGDVNGRAPVLHEAADDGRIAGYNCLRETPRSFCRRTRLGIVYTEPCIATVGEPEKEGSVTGSVDFSRQGRARLSGRASGSLKVWARSSDGLLQGAELCAPGGEHLAHQLAWAAQNGMTVGQMLGLPFYHPTLEEGLRTAVRRAVRAAGLSADSELPPCSGLPSGLD